MRLRISSLAERLRSSLFFVPMLGVFVGGALGQAFIYLDNNLDQKPGDLPIGIASTVSSARALLSTIASATITFAGIAFSISLLIIQLASSQFSPRIVHTLFRDPFTNGSWLWWWAPSSTALWCSGPFDRRSRRGAPPSSRTCRSPSPSSSGSRRSWASSPSSTTAPTPWT